MATAHVFRRPVARGTSSRRSCSSGPSSKGRRGGGALSSSASASSSASKKDADDAPVLAPPARSATSSPSPLRTLRASAAASALLDLQDDVIGLTTEGSGFVTPAPSRAEPSSSNDNDDNDVTERFKALLEDLSSQRGSTREAALVAMHKLAMENYMAATFEGQLETLLDALKRNLKKGTGAQLKAAADMIGLLFVTSVVDDEGLFEEVYGPLEDCIRNTRNTDVCCACIAALALCCFVASSDTASSSACLALFESVIAKENADPDTRAAAFEAWTLIATTITDKGTILHAYESTMHPHILASLASDNMDLCLAAGGTLAFLVETLGDSTNDAVMDMNGLDDAIELLHGLVSSSSKHRAKKERSRQRSAFRDILRGIEEGEPPNETAKFKRDVLNINSWATVRQMEAMRDCLGEGLHIHFNANPIVREIFDLPPVRFGGGGGSDDVTKMTGLEKRFYLSSNSPAAKERTRRLAQQRHNKSSSSNMYFSSM